MLPYNKQGERENRRSVEAADKKILCCIQNKDEIKLSVNHIGNLLYRFVLYTSIDFTEAIKQWLIV